ncbi:MAG: 1,4-dihydroxy-2-naphthoate polyprenyltransferase [Acidimicrobiales bacterium]
MNLKLFIEGARPKTLPASIGPVIVGLGLTFLYGPISIARAALAAVVALGLQIGTNFANDYSDGVRGTDNQRSGPRRLVGSGLVAAPIVRRAALGSFAVAALAGLVLVLLSSWWLIFIGAASLLAGWYYTGGKRPYGYYGFGELFVFIFFGLVETLGTVYVQDLKVTVTDLLCAISIGLMVTSILVANNLRDIPSDRESGKKTLAVRIGDQGTRVLYVSILVGSAVVLLPLVVAHPIFVVGLLWVPLLLRPIRLVRSGAVGRELIPAIASSGRVVFLASLVVAIGLVLEVVVNGHLH